MCTASWMVDQSGFQLFFNRDEQRSRAPALPPREVEIDGVRAVMPIDGQDHGTWIAANEFGLVVCLLNFYEVDYAPAEPLSRGHLVQAVAPARDGAAAVARLAREPLERLRAFTFAVFDATATFASVGPRVARWDGAILATSTDERIAPPLVSSGFDLPRVRAARLDAWDKIVVRDGGVSSERLARFHASEQPGPGPLAVAMSRPDACTVSHTHVKVTHACVTMTYSVGAPHAGAPTFRVELARRGDATL